MKSPPSHVRPEYPEGLAIGVGRLTSRLKEPEGSGYRRFGC